MCILPKAKDNHTSYMYCMHVAMATCVAGHVLTVVHHLATCTICALYTVLCCTNTYIIINIIVLCFHCTFHIHNVKNNLCDIWYCSHLLLHVVGYHWVWPPDWVGQLARAAKEDIWPQAKDVVANSCTSSACRQTCAHTLWYPCVVLCRPQRHTCTCVDCSTFAWLFGHY